MAFPWQDAAVAVLFLVGWSVFWHFALEAAWVVFGEEIIYMQLSMMQG